MDYHGFIMDYPDLPHQKCLFRGIPKLSNAAASAAVLEIDRGSASNPRLSDVHE